MIRMPRSYSCPECSSGLVTFMQPGESAKCGECGATSRVPDSAQERTVGGLASAPPGEAARAEPLRSSLAPEGTAAGDGAAPARRWRWMPFFAGTAVGCLGMLLLVVGLFWWSLQRMQQAGFADSLAGHFEAPPVPTGRASYAWNLRTPDGEPVNVDAFRGRVLFVNRWATWCPPCVAELPSIARLRETVRSRLGPDRQNDIAFLCLSDEPARTVQGFEPMVRTGLPAYVIEGPSPPEFDSPVIPATFLVDRNGRIVFSHEGGATWDADECVEYLVGLVEAAR